jgi:hypothetical protein
MNIAHAGAFDSIRDAWFEFLKLVNAKTGGVHPEAQRTARVDDRTA